MFQYKILNYMLNLTKNKLLISNTKIRDINNNLLSYKDNPSSTKE